MRMRPLWSMVALAAIAFAGCGDDDNESDGGAESVETAAESAAEGVGDTAPDAESADESDSSPSDDSGGGGEAAGTWQLSQQTFDENANYLLDSEELATATGPEYGIFVLEIGDDGACTFSGSDEEGVGTCQLGSCDDLAFGNVDCEVLEQTGARMLAIEPGPTSVTTLGGRYGVLGLTGDELILKDMTGAQGTIYVYKPA